jgi:hypothetical protein
VLLAWTFTALIAAVLAKPLLLRDSPPPAPAA